MKQVKIGTYAGRFSEIDIYLREGTGGEFYTYPEAGRLPRIKIGAYSKSQWAEVVKVALHELMELHLLQVGARYSPNPDSSADSGNYLFVHNHTQFSEAIADTAYVLTSLLPDMTKAWKKFHG